MTAGTTTTLADLDALGVRFPTNEIYEVTITGRGRYGSIDEAVGPGGIGDPIPKEARTSAGPSVPREVRALESFSRRSRSKAPPSQPWAGMRHKRRTTRSPARRRRT